MNISRVLTVLVSVLLLSCNSGLKVKKVPDDVMQKIYDEVKTPYKYGIVMTSGDSTKMVDSPTVFRNNDKWFMTYIVFDGHGYETWLAESYDLLNWDILGKILLFTKNTWDATQKAGYVSLIDIEWGGSYKPEKFRDRFWMSYLGGSDRGYEAGKLKTGIASTEHIDIPQEWRCEGKPVLSPDDVNARWYDNATIYKSLIIEDKEEYTGHSFVMYYNAKGDTARYESIAMAVSDDMKTWTRFGNAPVISKYRKGTICGDAQISRIGKVYVMFFFGAFWGDGPQAFDKFACSYDLIHWKEWQGADLISPSETYDRKYAHKPWVVKWNDVVYHFYTAVGDHGRVIALATSEKLN